MQGAALSALGVALPGCLEEPTAPTPPDVSHITAAYEAPRGVLTGASVASVQLALDDILSVVDKVDNFQNISDNVRDAQKELDSLNGTHGPSEFPIELQIEGSAQLTGPCTGWGEADATPGAYGLTLGFNHQGLIPTVWGDFTQCRLETSDGSIGLHGSIILTITGGTGYDDAHLGAMTYIFEGDVSAPDVEATPLDFDFQVPEAGGLLVRLPLGLLTPQTGTESETNESRDLIYFETANDSVGFVAANGTFTCNFEAKSCVSSDGASNNAVTW